MRTPARVGAGVPDGGRFAPSRRPAAPVALDDPLPAPIRSAIGSIDPRHVSWANSRDTASLAGTAEPALAAGRCFFASRAVHDHLDGAGLPPGELVEVLMDGNSDHYANAFIDDDGTYIVDYTCRQFDPDADWPVTARFEDWLQQLSDACARNGLRVQTYDFGFPDDFD